MTNSPIAPEIHESLDTHRDFTAQIAFDREVPHSIAKSRDFGLAQILHLGGWINTCARADLLRSRTTDAVDVRQRNPDVFVYRDVDPCDSCHCLLLFRVLSLTLLVAWVRADDADYAIAPNDLAVSTHLSD